MSPIMNLMVNIETTLVSYSNKPLKTLKPTSPREDIQNSHTMLCERINLASTLAPCNILPRTFTLSPHAASRHNLLTHANPSQWSREEVVLLTTATKQTNRKASRLSMKITSTAWIGLFGVRFAGSRLLCMSPEQSNGRFPATNTGI